MQFISIRMILKILIIKQLKQDDAQKLTKSEPQFKKESQLTTAYHLESLTHLIYFIQTPGSFIRMIATLI